MLLCIDTTPTTKMIIKIDCREKDLLELMKPSAAISVAPTSAPEPAPDHYIMDLGDGVTMKVPLPKKTVPTTKKSLATTTAVLATNHEIKSERLPLGDIILHDPRQGQQKDIVIFERKTLADLAASIRDGRYKEQSSNCDLRFTNKHQRCCCKHIYQSTTDKLNVTIYIYI